MVKCICIDDSNRPNEIPQELWVEKGNEYHITHIYFHNLQRVSGCDLKELRLTEDCYPYETYKLSRFAFTEESFRQMIELAKLCTDLNELDISKILEEELILNK